MRNYHLHLSDLPRTLEGVLPLSALVSYDNAMGVWNGRRGNMIEFAGRFASTDPYSVDIQDGVETRIPFPHVYLKYPESDFHSPPFAPRMAFSKFITLVRSIFIMIGSPFVFTFGFFATIMSHYTQRCNFFQERY